MISGCVVHFLRCCTCARYVYSRQYTSHRQHHHLDTVGLIDLSAFFVCMHDIHYYSTLLFTELISYIKNINVSIKWFYSMFTPLIVCEMFFLKHILNFNYVSFVLQCLPGANIRLASYLFKTLRDEAGSSSAWCFWKDCDT